jgi:Fe-S cluster assembly protein SufD
MTAVKETPGIFLKHFARLEEKLGRNDGWLHDLRKNAIKRFAELGFPTTRLEDWKNTNVSPIAQIPFQAAEFRWDGLTDDRLSELPLAHSAFRECCSRIVFVNGHYSPQLSSSDIPERIVVGSLASAIKQNAPRIKEHLARSAAYQQQAFVALNTAFLEDGAYVDIPDGVTADTPIYILFVSTADESIASHPRSLIIVGENSQAAIIEDYLALGDGSYFTNAVTEITAREHSRVEHYSLQDENEKAFHVSTISVNQARSSSLTAHSVSLGGSLVRNDIIVALDGEGAECTLNGLYIADGKQHVDNHTVIDHVQPHCASRELYKGILDDQSSAVFNGTIVVRKDAQKTDARQSNKNLLLSEGATINSKPQLEINADDVKCAHGTSIGHLDEDSVYYLRSRGVGLAEARTVLTYGFANDVLNRMKVDAVRVRLECALLARLSGSHAPMEER